MDKTKRGPVDKTTQKVIDGAQKFQQEVNRLGFGKPKFVQGTIEPSEKKQK